MAKNSELLFKISIIFIFIFGITYLIYSNYLYLKIGYEDAYKSINTICLNKGYNKATDLESIEGGKYECDGEVQEDVLELVKKETCLRKNKWGDCSIQSYDRFYLVEGD